MHGGVGTIVINAEQGTVHLHVDDEDETASRPSPRPVSFGSFAVPTQLGVDAPPSRSKPKGSKVQAVDAPRRVNRPITDRAPPKPNKKAPQKKKAAGKKQAAGGKGSVEV